MSFQAPYILRALLKPSRTKCRDYKRLDVQNWGQDRARTEYPRPSLDRPAMELPGSQIWGGLILPWGAPDASNVR